MSNVEFESRPEQEVRKRIRGETLIENRNKFAPNDARNAICWLVGCKNIQLKDKLVFETRNLHFKFLSNQIFS